MRTVQMTLDDELVSLIDKAAKRLKTTPQLGSSLVICNTLSTLLCIPVMTWKSRMWQARVL